MSGDEQAARVVRERAAAGEEPARTVRRAVEIGFCIDEFHHCLTAGSSAKETANIGVTLTKTAAAHQGIIRYRIGVDAIIPGVVETALSTI